MAPLSRIHSLLQIFDAKIGFIFGTGIIQVTGLPARPDDERHGPVVDGLFIGLLLPACCCGAENGREKNRRAHSSVALDGLLLVLPGMWIDAAVHAYALYRMWQGYAASRELAELLQAAQPGLSPAGAPAMTLKIRRASARANLASSSHGERSSCFFDSGTAVVVGPCLAASCSAAYPFRSAFQ